MADPELALRDWLAAELPDARIATEVPQDLDAALTANTDGVVVVSTFGGSDDAVYTIGTPSVDFDCYAGTRAAARILAQTVRHKVRADLVGAIVGASGNRTMVSRTRTIALPHWTPYENTDVRRFIYSAQIRLHDID